MPETSAPRTSSAPRTNSATSKRCVFAAISNGVCACATASATRLECQSHERGAVLQVTVLGKSPSWQDAGGACSGYLIQEEDFALLLDCGNGVFSKLRGVL